ncbi:MAG: SDR family NAD(P)-dependent oxidoreductase [Pseudomonadota bacterium]
MARTALVTGGNRGIGEAIVEGLAEAGYNVILGARDAARGQATADAISKRTGKDIDVLAIDVASVASMDAALPKIVDRLDVLVNNAGILPNGNMLSMPWDDIEASTNINALGPLYLSRAVIPGMASRGYGRVVNVSSGWGSLNSLGPGAYGITKAFLNAITVKTAGEAPGSVLINAMCPGWVRTDMGGSGAMLTPQQGADTALYLAALPDGGPTGRIFRARKEIAWDE